MAILSSVLAIIVCGVLGGIAGWAVTQALDWQGTAAAIVAAVIAMVVASALWAVGSTLVRVLVRQSGDDE
jgi:hypothetical protein